MTTDRLLRESEVIAAIDALDEALPDRPGPDDVAYSEAFHRVGAAILALPAVQPEAEGDDDQHGDCDCDRCMRSREDAVAARRHQGQAMSDKVEREAFRAWATGQGYSDLPNAIPSFSDLFECWRAARASATAGGVVVARGIVRSGLSCGSTGTPYAYFDTENPDGIQIECDALIPLAGHRVEVSIRVVGEGNR